MVFDFFMTAECAERDGCALVFFVLFRYRHRYGGRWPFPIYLVGIFVSTALHPDPLTP
jgi:hypothetical protein